MVNTAEHSAFFHKQAADGKIVVKDPPKFDLETYIANYEGRTRLDRLILIGSTSTYLAVDAFRLAIAEAKSGKDVDRYLQAVECLHQISPDDPLGIPDLGSADTRMKQVKAETDRLEHELKGYKNNLIKESIRMGNEDLGAHYYNIGDMASAHRAYSRMREFCTLPKHIAEIAIKIILVAVAQRNWMLLHTQVQKIQPLNLKSEENAKIEPALDACHGLAHMSSHRYRDAAEYFLKTKPSFITLESVGGVMFQREVLSANDVAVYGGLCALASMNRADLQSLVLAKSDFRQFLELEPHIRRAVSLFCSSKYAACLEILEAYRSDWLLDIYLQPLIGELFHLVRTKCIVQYLKPFSCVSLNEMTKAFAASSNGSIEEELVEMIQNRHLDAKVDLVERLLISPPENLRQTLHSNVLIDARSYEKSLRLRLVRLNMQYAGLELTQPRSSQRSGPGRPSAGDVGTMFLPDIGSSIFYEDGVGGNGKAAYGGEPMSWT